MRRACAISLLALAVELAWAPVASAEEHETVCEDPRVRIQGRPDGRWLEPIVRACEDLRTMPDADATARVRIVPAGADLIVEVTLKDGRSTLRRVQEPSRLGTTLEALLTVPPTLPATDSPDSRDGSAESPSRGSADPTRAERLVDERNGERSPVPSSPAQPSFGIEIGGALGGRLAAREYYSLAPAGFAQLRAREWLFGMSVRWEALQWKSDVVVSNFEMDTLAAGLCVARRFRPSFGSFVMSTDIGLSPRLVAETQSFQGAPGASAAEEDEQADTQTDVRFGVFARTAFGSAPLRLFVELDGELSPGRLRRDIRLHPALPPLPSWSSGIGLGVTWGEP